MMVRQVHHKTKIAIFHSGFIYSGGGERIVLEEARGLRKKGYEVEVYAPTYDAKKCYPELSKEIGVKMFLPSFIEKLPARFAIRMVATSFLAPFLAFGFSDVDIFVGANQPGAWIAFCISKVLGKPYIVYLNQPNRLVYPRPVDFEYGWTTTVKDYQFLYKIFRFLRPLLAWFDRLSINSTRALFVNGSYIGAVIEQIYGRWIIDAPAGAYAQARSSLRINPHTAYEGAVQVGKFKIKKPYALITNRHDPQKKFDYVIHAMRNVLRRYPQAKLVIPGVFTEHTQKLIQLAKKEGLEKNVLFLGQITEADLQSLYRHACVYCYPAPEEDFGLGPLEAGGWGVPTVAWNHAGPTVTVEDGVTGFLAKPYEVSDYAKAINKLLGDPKLRAKMGKAAWERTKNKFSWDKHVDILEKSILRLV